MSFPLTIRVIKLLCGRETCNEGEALLQDDKVLLTSYNPEVNVYKATVRDGIGYEVYVEIDQDGDVKADCDCPSHATSDYFCAHIAAVLLHIHELRHDGAAAANSTGSEGYASSGARTSGGTSTTGWTGRAGELQLRHGTMGTQRQGRQGLVSSQTRLANAVLGLFSERPPRSTAAAPYLEHRTLVEVEFLLRPFPTGSRTYMLALELKLGTQRMYIVQKLRAFLEAVEHRQPFPFSKSYTYDPAVNCFRTEDDDILQQLVAIYHHELWYKQTSQGNGHQGRSISGERMLLIPPSFWKTLRPLLNRSSAVRLEQDGTLHSGIQVVEDAELLEFRFDQAQGQVEEYALQIERLDDILLLEPYGAALYEGKMIPLSPDSCRRLSELKQLLDTSRQREIRIQPEQMESFMEKVIPGLRKLGSVTVAPAVADRIVRHPLRAKLYLDRIRQRLLASLEFTYGDIVLNPLEESSTGHGGRGYILMRDGDQEQQIISLMEHSAFARTDSGYFMEDEAAEYDFLYHTVPQLEQLLDIYATSAVKERLYQGPAPIKITVDVDERTDWLELRFQVDRMDEAAIRELLQSLELRRKYYRLPEGALMPLDTEEFREIVRLMNEAGVTHTQLEGGSIRVPVARAFQLTELLERGTVVQSGQALRQFMEDMGHPEMLRAALPDKMESVLREYQKYGFQWMKTLARYRFGGILADDMGLGKTLQSIAYIVSSLPEIRERRQPALVLAPASLIYNWANELRKFAPELRAMIIDGERSERTGSLETWSEQDVVITSYPLLRKDKELYGGMVFHTMILDEAQAIKNHTSQTAQAVREIVARQKFALTGTPIENALEELWSIFHVVFPELLQGKQDFQALSREQVAKRIRPFVLRRLKRDVLTELPEKMEYLQVSELLPEQKRLYAAFLAKLRQDTLKHLDDNTIHKHRIRILAGLTRLRQICCHPALCVEGYTGSSAKLEQLLEIVEECRSSGRRMLIFSQFTQMLDLIRREFTQLGVQYFYLDGQTPPRERVELCAEFNEGSRDAFLISLKAGGTGLNLTGADTVILFDLWWNPAVEQQAMDRAHRMGQKNAVQVIRLVTQHTVEDKMVELQQRKKNLVEEVLHSEETAESFWTEEELREILMLQPS